MHAKIKPLTAAKQYQQALVLYGQWHQAYDALPQPTKQEFRGLKANLYYNEACYNSLAKDRATAVAKFQGAVAAGYQNYAHASSDTDLDFIRADERFQRALLAVREKGDYRYILQQTQGYATQGGPALPAFRYQSAGEAHLAQLRKTYKLDSIAGAGTDVSQMINLMHWVHELVPHDGNHENPRLRNAQDFITVCQREKRGLNCRGLATVLNEAYLAMGFKARFIGCLPKDTADVDSHVINSVYSVSQQKWLYMDPTHDAYVMNEQGNLLSIEEVRERLLNGKPLLLNPTANWNHKQTTTKEEYLYSYMAKNLYQLETPVSSEYNAETRADGKRIEYIRLVPLSAKPQPLRAMQVNKTTLTTYATSNAAAFWQKP
ncbi:transglutaminase-like domain-containing protein [Hymenobacter sp. 5516J-16]|nr:transglutaminase-like domain-containing protein [Hymenobacter sp. 5516J-16]UOQ76143.1 transglutaminase-like domain-containing protein [Hymenobacter sp. 5516J-16]